MPLRTRLSILALLLILLSACIPQPADTPTVIPATVAPTGIPTDWLEIYFSTPDSPSARNYSGGPDEPLAAAIDDARLSVDVAAYNLTLWSIRDALLRAYHRGVVVRMVMESDNMDTQEVQDLKAAGIPIVGDLREGLMHNKFVIIDRAEVWTGSMNLTLGAYWDNNNLVRIRSTQVAEDYTTKFNSMYVEDQFSLDAVAEIPYPRLAITDATVEILFSPKGGVAQRIADLIQNAQSSIYFLAYSFTSDEIGAAVMDRAQNGVTVSGVMDEDQIASNTGTEWDTFLQAGLDVRKDGNDGLMHHKVFIIDRKIVITGSYNFTASAEERNDENVVIIHNVEAAVTYLEEFWRIYLRAQQP